MALPIVIAGTAIFFLAFLYGCFVQAGRADEQAERMYLKWMEEKENSDD